MRWPLVALAVPATLLGLLAIAANKFSLWTSLEVWQAGIPRDEPVTDFPQVDLEPHLVTSMLSVALVLIGAGAVYAVWRRARAGDPTADLRVRNALERAFFVDDLYDRLFVRPVRRATRGVGWTDDSVVGGAVTGVGAQTGRLAAAVSRTQGGNVQSYLTGLLAGVLLLVLVVVTLA